MSLPKPFYQDDWATIYCGDCRDILPLLPKVDLVLTDPPYGIGLDTDYSRRGKSFRVKGGKYSVLNNDVEAMDFKFLFNFPADKMVIFGANNFPNQLPYNSYRDGWICWDKRTNEAADKLLGSPFELAVVLGQRTYKIIRLQHCGVKNADGDNAGRFHPTQKPIVLFTRILSFFPQADSILDPFMGSGTTLRAAKDLKRKSIGIEIEPKYCEIAVKRLRQEVLI